MEKSSQNIQDSFLNNARKEKTAVTIYLLGGVRLNGRIKSFDKYSLILESNSQEHLVFKHAISTVVTGRSAHQPPHVHAHAAGARHDLPGEQRHESSEG
jgi:host factor-I protein